ncbi:MAG: UDP-N-acetylmuramoyl-L-alanine--D-glutamate ligase [Thermodesulfobacteriota bacterium]
MKIKGEKFLVAGLGKTGAALCRFLVRAGAEVAATEARPREEVPECEEMENLGVKVEAGGHTEKTFASAGTVILSPGVPPGIAPLRAARREGASVTGEAEFAFRLSRLPVVAVTGSNGKTTTTALTASILRRCGRRVFVGGNFGDPYINSVGRESEYDIALLEMSSFQLKTTSSFSPLIAVLLNISPNHLDVHPTYADYANSKKKIFANQTPEQWAVVNGADSEALSAARNSRSQKVIFDSSLSAPAPGVVTASGARVFCGGQTYDLSGAKFEGKHNMENAMAAIAVSSILGCPSGEAAAAAREFSPPPHRMEFVREVSGARVYDDSKATNPAATAKALDSLKPPVVLISGGRDKKTGYSVLRSPVESKVSSLVLFGESRDAMFAELGGLAKTVLTESLEQAVASAVENSRPGGSILFSPACSSFDMFSSFEERGREFQRIVKSFG